MTHNELVKKISLDQWNARRQKHFPARLILWLCESASPLLLALVIFFGGMGAVIGLMWGLCVVAGVYS